MSVMLPLLAGDKAGVIVEFASNIETDNVFTVKFPILVSLCVGKQCLVWSLSSDTQALGTLRNRAEDARNALGECLRNVSLIEGSASHSGR